MGIIELISRINWVDVLIVILLFRISYVGFNRGLANEIIPLIGIFTTLTLAFHYYPRFGAFIGMHTIIPDRFTELVAFLIIVFILKVIFHIIEALIVGKIVTVQIVSLYDKIGGLIAGAVRSVLLISIILAALELTHINYIYYSVREKSLMGERFSLISQPIYKKTASFLRLR